MFGREVLTRENLLLRAQVEDLQSQRDQALARLEEQERRNQALVERMLAMKERGFESPRVVTRPESAGSDVHLEPEILLALETVQEPGLEDTVRAWRRSGLSVEECVAQVYAGGVAPPV